MLLSLFSKKRISYKLMLVLFVIGLVPLSGTIVLSYQISKQALVAEAEQNAIVKADLFAGQVQLQMDKTEQIMERILGIDEVHQFFALSHDAFDTYQQLAIRAQIPQILNNFTFIPGLNDINLMRSDGVLLHLGTTTEMDQVDPIRRDFLLEFARENGGSGSWIGIHDYTFSNDPQKRHSPSLAVVMPFEQFNVRSRQNEVLGLILINVDAPLFFESFQKMNANVAIIDQIDHFVFHHQQAQIATLAPDPLIEILNESQSGMLDLGDERMLIQQSMVNRGLWRLVLFQSEQALLASIARSLWLFVEIAVAAVLVILLAVWYVEHHYVKPLSAVSNGLRNLYGDKAAKAEPLPIKSDDEIGVLVKWFNRYLREIRQRIAMEKSLRASEARYALATSASNDALFEWDFITDRVYYSSRCESLFGTSSTTADKSFWLDSIVAEDLPMVRNAIEQHLKGRREVLHLEYGFKDAVGDVRQLHTRALVEYDHNQKPLRMAGSHTDVTVRRQQEAQLQYDANHDYLTGLNNRQWLFGRMRDLLNRPNEQSQTCFAIALFDLDGFKLVNDTLGHDTGDRLLQAVAERLVAHKKECVDLVRLGGDEFILLLDVADKGQDEVMGSVQQLLQALAQPFHITRHGLHTSASAGIVFSATGDMNTKQSPEDLLRDADIALYRAKDQGKNCCVAFEPYMRQQLLDAIELEKQLKIAITNEKLSLNYQPIYSLQSHSIVGCEVLVRWIHPELGFISPAEFIVIAERSSLIHDLGQWVYRHACQQLQQWDLDPSMPKLDMSINVSPKQLDDSGFFESAPKLLADLEIDPNRISLELTETAVIENTERNRQLLAELKQAGFRLYLDDFGTGYSSIMHLATTPFDTIKIDKSFVDKACVNERDNRLLVSLLAMAKQLEVNVVAEGIENRDQLNLLKVNGCQYGQGYLLARPLAAEQFVELVRENNKVLC